ncbi:MAG TPA: response regulator transcription factor [Candidatus Angelobacter sp.]|nr:response regulator transcription factor [Candidatus Angelobacter sp.]
MIKVLLVDDHPMVLKGLTFFLKTQADMEVIGEAHNGEEALQFVRQQSPDVVLMDLSMPVMDGIETTKQLHLAYPDVKVIILTSFADQDHVLPAIKAGASGYQLKDVEPEELAQTIRQVFNGKRWLHPDATSQLLTHVVNEDEGTTIMQKRFNSLTNREKEVLYQITLGKGNKEIADTLFITEKTVKTHVSNLLSKLSLHDRTQVAIYAMKNKWVESE